MSTHLERASFRIVLRFALALIAAAMFTACASEPTKHEEVTMQPPPTTTPAPEVPAAAPAAAPPAKAPPAAAPAKPVLPEGTTYFVHTVRYQGETVSIIAAWYLGDKMRFDVLAAANPEVNPALVRLGMRIKIPESMAKTREPMPKEFVDGFYKRPPTDKSPPPERPKEEEPVPIGPK